ncbi:MAG TPA: immunoglobulin domain-containing protein [Candidatus Acidoferrum sp.]|nr:immunoglobulin domain-containing protein [Candidatus Acidoferrum sp.]
MVCAAIQTLLAISALCQVHTNWLANPGFELGMANWTYYGDYEYPGNYTNQGVLNTNQFVLGTTPPYVSAHAGTNAFKAWGNYNTWLSHNGRRQMFAAAPGSTWSASGWVSTQVPDQITGNKNGSDQAVIYVDFLNSSGTITSDVGAPGPDVLERDSALAITTNSPTSTWIFLQVTDYTGDTNLTAPYGTAYVRFSVDFSQPACYTPGGYNAGSAYYDDMALYNTTKPDPEITVQPQAVPAAPVYGQTVTLTVVADGLTPLSYLWQQNGASITSPKAHGITTATLTLSNVDTSLSGNYTVTVTDQAGPLTSDGVYVGVLDPGIISMTPPLGQTLTNGSTARFAVVAAGSSTLMYQWATNGSLTFNGGRISGADSNVLTVANVTAADAGTYSVSINGGAAQTNAGLKVVSPAQLATNLLINPGFEDGVFSVPWESGWVPFNGAALATTNDTYYGSATPVSVFDGSYVCRTYNGSPDNGLYENSVPLVAGTTYHAGGHFYVSSLDPVISPAYVVLQLAFKDAGGAQLGPTMVSRQIDPTFTTDAWTAVPVTNATGGLDLVAPAGTVAATCQIYEYCQQGGGGSVYFDDLYVTAATVQPPPTRVKITPWATTGSINLSWPSTSGVTYEVLSGNSLTSPITWSTNATVAGDGTTKSVAYPTSATQKFYRLLEHY